MNEIGLIYGYEHAKIGSFWYYFFRMCGIWCSKHIINFEKEWRTFSDFNPVMNLVIIGEKIVDDKEKYKICYVTDVTNFYVRGQVTKTSKKILTDLKKQIEEKEIISELKSLLEFYSKNNVWSYLWEYHEVWWNSEPPERTKMKYQIKKILNAAEKERINTGKYGKHAYIFLNFTHAHLKQEGYHGSNTQSKILLMHCKYVSNRFPDFFSMYILSGKICELDQINDKFALIYYRQALKYSNDAQLLYFIGREMENRKRSMNECYFYYERAYYRDINNYRALFKMGWRAEWEGEIEKAINYYLKIIKQLSYGIKKSYTEILEFEYVCKVLLRLVRLYAQDVDLPILSQSYQYMLEKVVKDVEKDPFFTHMCRISGMDNKRLAACINEKIKKTIEAQMERSI